MQPSATGIEDAAGKGLCGNFLVLRVGDALELQMYLVLLCGLSDQPHQPSGQMADHQEDFEARAGTRARCA